MDYFTYHNQDLYAEQVKISDIATNIKTPFYLYSSKTLIRHYTVFNEALPFTNKLICFAVKSNSNIAVLKTLADLGAGADVVSQGEIFRAITAGIPADKIVFSGVGKTEEEITYALKTQIAQFHCESLEEIEMINNIAKNLTTTAKIAIRINPDVSADTHDKISTGKKGDKFGIDIEEAISIIKKIKNYQNINLKGISVHIGSQITSLEPFKKAFNKLIEFVNKLESENIATIDNIDFGGGLGAYYGNHNEVSPVEYGEMLSKKITKLHNKENKKFIFEPGRLIAANSGILVSSVILIKNTKNKKFAILDAAMNDLLRPALYNAQHQIIPIVENSKDKETYDFVGPICETSDIFGKNIEFNKLQTKDLIAIRSTGAYGAVMSSEYNSRPRIPEVMVKNNNYQVIKSRPTIAALINNETIPNWL